MRKLIYAGVAVVGLAVALVLALPMLVATDTIRNSVVAAVKDRTGRTLSIEGDVDLSVFPRIHLVANRVTLSNPSGFPADFATMERMEIDLGLLSALTGSPEIDGFVLVNPTINLAVDEAGRNNWTFGAAGTDGSASASAPDVSTVSAANFEVSNGLLTYANAPAGTQHTFDRINLKVDMASAAAPLTATGDMLWNGRPVKLTASLETLAGLNGGRPAKLAASLSAEEFSADLSGDLTRRDGGLELANARLATGGMTGTGTVSLKPAAGRPLLAADLAFDRLDLTATLGGEATAGNAGWSDRPVDLSGLNAVDGDVDLAVGEIRYGKIRTGAARIGARLRGGVLSANLSDLALYDGTANANATVDGRDATPAVTLKGELKGVDALPFFGDAADVEKIEGLTNVTFDLKSAGASTSAIMAALDGTADVNFEDGALIGVDVASILRAVAAGRTSGFAKGGKTPFKKLVASFRFNNGEGTNGNLNMSGGEAAITGGGSVNMPRQTLNYRVNPVLVGQGGITVLGINVPVIIAGPWANPRIYPELPGILDTPEMALKGLATVGEGGVKGVGGVLEKVVPLPGSNSGSNPLGNIFKNPF